jgi:hypothetical protein
VLPYILEAKIVIIVAPTSQTHATIALFLMVVEIKYYEVEIASNGIMFLLS